MRTTYEVRCGRRALGKEVAESAQEALVTFLIQYGTRNTEIVRLGVDRAAWRGAIYSAHLAVPAVKD
jgi:hypothetical protein